MTTKTVGNSGIEVSALGMGCWAIGGPMRLGDLEVGWGAVDDDESVRAIHAAMAAGVTLFDTAANYGTGHSERVLGRALAGRRSEAVLATKFGHRIDESARLILDVAVEPEDVRASCEASMRRLGTDYLDLFQLHVGDLDPARADDVRDTLESLVAEGSIRAYGWSTDDVDRARRFAGTGTCAAIQHTLNVMQDDPEMLALCERTGMASIARSPLGMGVLTGKFRAGDRLPDDDVRAQRLEWMAYFRDGRPNEQWLTRLSLIRDVLTSGGRTLAQGALAWLWARSPVTIPIPGIRTVRQAEENAGAMAFGPLTNAELAEIDRLSAPVAGDLVR
ncbi:aldo/keto reductase [Actinokineospora fastidiosa]|uniref:aldo/keto reductase n=1 Tax=Actinokineospora fastidiosa TaxID=1816 RepID=UPI00166FB302|nr:aldo/keto reductase [Actinokineospora fastidiosa]